MRTYVRTLRLIGWAAVVNVSLWATFVSYSVSGPIVGMR